MRRDKFASEGKSKIGSVVDPENLKLPLSIAGAIAGIMLIALAYSIYFNSMLAQDMWEKFPCQVVLITQMFVATFASRVFLYQARQQLSRGVFATLTGVALAVWGFQDGIFRRDDEWLVFHFYYDLTVALLMVFYLAIPPGIDRDLSHR